MDSENKARGGLLSKPGETLRELRLKEGLTLAELSERTGLPASTLSKVENDKMSLTYDKLARISEGLNLDVAQIFGSAKAKGEELAAQGRRSITRASDGGVIDTPSYTHVYHATDLLHKKFIPIIGEIKHRSVDEFGEFIRHEGEEYTFVLEGTLEFHSDLYAPVILETGDSIYFDSSMGHAYVAVGDAPCKVLSICSGHPQAVDFEVRRRAMAESSTADPAQRNDAAKRKVRRKSTGKGKAGQGRPSVRRSAKGRIEPK